MAEDRRLPCAGQSYLARLWLGAAATQEAKRREWNGSGYQWVIGAANALVDQVRRMLSDQIELVVEDEGYEASEQGSGGRRGVSLDGGRSIWRLRGHGPGAFASPQPFEQNARAAHRGMTVRPVAFWDPGC